MDCRRWWLHNELLQQRDHQLLGCTAGRLTEFNTEGCCTSYTFLRRLSGTREWCTIWTGCRQSDEIHRLPGNNCTWKFPHGPESDWSKLLYVKLAGSFWHIQYRWWHWDVTELDCQQHSSCAVFQRSSWSGEWPHQAWRWGGWLCHGHCFGSFESKSRHRVDLPDPGTPDLGHRSSCRLGGEGPCSA